ncbi:MAG: hypothetical protein BJ554DRAFT_1720 [Olpidium bornovanus]|uniref:TRAF3-interacting protein 1 N-terminal domain-containing protein n=1 Tax=Olpidium bornovanus TaxID=278681 RepID=A0A8H8DHH7_9FUNG|nr:MAG: hypothetical protein BJ554DRAFT_1720 [Olpidium bornovanus]
MNDSVAAKTQSALSAYVKNAPLTPKLLSKPPFRYLHDLISELIKSSGYAADLFSKEEADAANIKVESYPSHAGRKKKKKKKGRKGAEFACSPTAEFATPGRQGSEPELTRGGRRAMRPPYRIRKGRSPI